MKKLLLLPCSLVLLATACLAGKNGKKNENTTQDSIQSALMAYMFFTDSVTKAMRYETGAISLKGDHATLQIPEGFKFLNAEQSQYVLHKIWGNPERSDVQGMIFPATAGPFTKSSYAFVVTFEEMGYVKNNGARDINYDRVMKNMQQDETEKNKERIAAGFQPIHINGWAQKPFYDEKNNTLHWAKNLSFGENSDHNTLNYEVRVLGRNGVLSLNAVATMNELPLVKKDIIKVLSMVSFTNGNKYADFNSATDKVAVYGIGGLVAGKMLAKVGFWALISKFGKVMLVVLLAGFYGVKKWLTGRSEPAEEYVSAFALAHPAQA